MFKPLPLKIVNTLSLALKTMQKGHTPKHILSKLFEKSSKLILYSHTKIRAMVSVKLKST